MSENEVKPVAWRYSDLDEEVSFTDDPKWAEAYPDYHAPLYDQSAIDRLTAERDAAVAEVARVKASVGAIHYAVRTGFSAKAILVECVEAAPELAAIDAARSEGR